MGSAFSKLFGSRSSQTSPPAPRVPTQTLEQGSNDGVLRLLSWNIEGLGKHCTVERALEVCKEIAMKKPDVVYLQEIVPQTWEAITTRLRSQYIFYRDEDLHQLYPVRYYHILMVRVGSAVVPQGELEVTKFPKSTQDRSLLQLSVRYLDHDIILFTSHLESLVQNAIERKNQLKTTFQLMSEAADKNYTCIFGGDLNLMDKEADQVGIPEGFQDTWIACGSDHHHKYTWETCEPRFRLDRIYIASKCPTGLKPVKFELVGGSKVQELDSYPSDHLGIWTEFVLKATKSSDENKEDNETNINNQD